MCGSVRPAADGFSDRDRLGDLGSPAACDRADQVAFNGWILPSGFSGACREWPGGAGPGLLACGANAVGNDGQGGADQGSAGREQGDVLAGHPAGPNETDADDGMQPDRGIHPASRWQAVRRRGSVASSRARVSPPTAQAIWGSIHEDLGRCVRLRVGAADAIGQGVAPRRSCGAGRLCGGQPPWP